LALLYSSLGFALTTPAFTYGNGAIETGGKGLVQFPSVMQVVFQQVSAEVVLMNRKKRRHSPQNFYL